MTQLTARQEIVVRLIEANVHGQKSLLLTTGFEIDKAIQLADQILAKTAEPLEEWQPK